MPAIVIDALANDLKPVIDAQRRLMARHMTVQGHLARPQRRIGNEGLPEERMRRRRGTNRLASNSAIRI